VKGRAASTIRDGQFRSALHRHVARQWRKPLLLEGGIVFFILFDQSEVRHGREQRRTRADEQARAPGVRLPKLRGDRRR
jgi:hypothetical protein